MFKFGLQLVTATVTNNTSLMSLRLNV